MGHFKGVLFGLLCAACGTTSLICIKVLMLDFGADIYTSIALRSIILVVATTVPMSASKSPYLPKVCRKIPYLIMRGIFSLTTYFTLSAAQLYITLGESYTFLNLAPGFTVILGFFILRERISLMDFLSIVFLFAGGFFTAQPDFVFNPENDYIGNFTSTKETIPTSNRLKGSVIAICSAVSLALLSVLSRYLKEIPAFTQAAWTSFITMIVMVPSSYILGNGLILCGEFPKFWVVLSGFTFATALTAYAATFQEMPAAIAGLTPMAGSCVFGFLFDVIYFNEEVTAYSILGAALVMVALALILVKGVAFNHDCGKLKWIF